MGVCPPPSASTRALVSALSIANARQASPDLRDKLQARINAFHAAGEFAGVSVGFRLPDGAAFGLVAGVSDRATGREMQPDDRMLVGSTGKTFVAAVALQLVSENSLDIPSELGRCLASSTHILHQRRRYFTIRPNLDRGRKIVVAPHKHLKRVTRADDVIVASYRL